ncbi:MAG: hypothetical protein V4787_14370 [Pseudomonadota bacterium]
MPGRQRRAWPGRGAATASGSGAFAPPAGAQFAALPKTHSLQVTTPLGASKRIGGVGRAAGQLNYPSDVAVLGELAYVVETGNHRVQVFDAAGVARGTIGEGVLNYPGGIITTADEILVSDSRNARIVGFDTQGRVTRTIGVRPPERPARPRRHGGRPAGRRSGFAQSAQARPGRRRSR